MKRFGIVVAGGTGTRMGNTARPKQYLPLAGKPVLVHTMEKFCAVDGLEKVIVLCPGEWVSYTKSLLADFFPGPLRYVVLEGGVLRNDTIMNAIRYIDEQYGIEEDTYLVTHDAVRPLVTKRILEENIACGASGAPCNTVFPAVDTLVESLDGETICRIPDRATLYHVQTPQSFRAEAFRRIYSALSEEEKKTQTDAIGMFVQKGEKVTLIRGEAYNIKLTYPSDLKMAEILLTEETAG